MRALATALVLAISLFAAEASARIPGFLSGSAYVAQTAEARTTYVMGMFDVLLAMQEQTSDPAVQGLIGQGKQCFRGRNAIQIREFVDEYMKADPASLNYAMSSNFLAAIRTRCPA